MAEFPTNHGFFVRVVVIYKQPEHYREIVERCPNHITKQKDGESESRSYHLCIYFVMEDVDRPANNYLLYSCKFLLNSTRFHWLLWGHMTSNNETVSCQNLWAGNVAKNLWHHRVTIQWLLPVSVDQWPLLRRGLMTFQLENFQQYEKSLKDWSLGK